MNPNNNQLKGDLEIFAYPGGKAWSSVWKTFGFYKKEGWSTYQRKSGHDKGNV